LINLRRSSFTLFVSATSTTRHCTPRLLLSSLSRLRLISGGPTAIASLRIRV
ncbi:unnamed protein product, partial [Brassica rapa subsp. narinosa]